MDEGTMRTLRIWSGGVALFGLGLCGAAFEATDGFVRFAYPLLGGPELTLTPELRFSIGLMGAVSLGWGLSLLAVAMSSADVPGMSAPALWRRLCWACFAWYLIDSAISIATGFALNAVSNTAIIAALIAILWRGRAFDRIAGPARPLSREGGMG